MNSLSTKFILHDMLPENLLLQAERQLKHPQKLTCASPSIGMASVITKKRSNKSAPMHTLKPNTRGTPSSYLFIIFLILYF